MYTTTGLSKCLAIVLGVCVVIGSFLSSGWSVGVQSVGAQMAERGNPLTVIIDKLDEIHNIIRGFQEGNHTLRWDQALPAATRFVVLATFGGAAVRDNETGLVWELAPTTTMEPWAVARFQCVGKIVGGRKGWRLPSIPELASIVDASVLPATLPPGHPFTNVQLGDPYWSATTLEGGPAQAWAMFLANANVTFPPKTDSGHIWCVRGGMNADEY